MSNKTDAQVVAALVAMGFNERDGRWAQNACLVLFESERESIVASAVTVLPQLDELEIDAVLPALRRVTRRFPSLQKTVADTLAARFNPVAVQGEISGFSRAASGHCYFTLKDSEGQAALLRSELAYQNHVAASAAYAALPRGPVHADLFRDNVMFDGEELTGFFDFYFAGVDTWLFDLAVCLNDWCIDLATGAHDAERATRMLDAYQAVRPLNAAERELLPAMLRAGALRFWISRLWDFYLPREASMLTPHDPTHFERVLRARIAHPVHP